MEHHHFIDGRNKEGLILPNILEIYGYKIYFWSNESDEPIHIHISKGIPVENSTKIWITKNGGCVVANNNSQIPEKELREILETVQNSYFLIIAKWKRHFPNKEIKYYC